eukprot:scaffold2881_cov115-Pinguiococcus_pyrenoidosus.AAC.1
MGSLRRRDSPPAANLTRKYHLLYGVYILLLKESLRHGAGALNGCEREPAAGAATGRPVFCSSLFGLPQEKEARAYTFSLETFSQ